MKSVEVRLVGRFRLTGKVPGHHERLLYAAAHTQNEETYILKGQEAKSKPMPHFLTILQQGKILQTMQGGIGIPHMQWCGQEQDYNFIVLEQLERGLDIYLEKCGGRFSTKTALMLGIEVVSILQYFHFKNFIHNNLHPHHLLMGHGAKYGKLFLIDYSNASRFRDGQTLEHIPDLNSDKRFEKRNSNLLFTSIRCHRGLSTSRKDDLISLIYLLLYFLEGGLPWSGIIAAKKTTEERSKAVLEAKENITPQDLFRKHPDLLMLYEYTSNLKFDEKPRYTYFRNVFRQRMQRDGYIEDGIFDWMLLTEDFQTNLEDFQLNFEIVPNQEEFIRHLAEEMKDRERVQTDALEKKKVQSHGKQGKTDKQCIIY